MVQNFEKPDPICAKCPRLTLLVTTGTYNLQSVILKVAPVGKSSQTSGLSPYVPVTNIFSKLVITKFADQLKVKDTSKLVNGISSILQKLLIYSNGTVFSNSFVPSSFAS